MDILPLTPWPDPALPEIKSLTVRVRLDRDTLRLRYRLQGDLDGLRLPPPDAHPAARDGLWQHTCFEAFLGDASGPGYLEFNFSPSGHWAEYAFSEPRVRTGHVPTALAAAPGRGRERDVFTLEAGLRRAALDRPVTGHTLLGFATVLENRAGRLSYWALSHPGRKPDFHDRRGWSARVCDKDDIG